MMEHGRDKSEEDSTEERLQPHLEVSLISGI